MYKVFGIGEETPGVKIGRKKKKREAETPGRY